jgi:hypothetical protein
VSTNDPTTTEALLWRLRANAEQQGRLSELELLLAEVGESGGTTASILIWVSKRLTKLRQEQANHGSQPTPDTE